MLLVKIVFLPCPVLFERRAKWESGDGLKRFFFFYCPSEEGTAAGGERDAGTRFSQSLSPIESAGDWKARLGEKTAKNQRKRSERNMNMNSFFFLFSPFLKDWQSVTVMTADCELLEIWLPLLCLSFTPFFSPFFSLCSPLLHRSSSTEQRNRWPPKRVSRPNTVCFSSCHSFSSSLFPTLKSWLPSSKTACGVQKRDDDCDMDGHRWEKDAGGVRGYIVIRGSESLWISTFVCCWTSCTLE